MALIDSGSTPDRGRRVQRRAGGRRPGDQAASPQLLVLRALGLGDLLTAVPALRALRRGLPEHHLVLATPPSLAPLVSLIGGIDALHPTADLDDFHWSGPAPELAVNLHGRGPQSIRALLRSGAQRILTHRPSHFDSGWLDPDLVVETQKTASPEILAESAGTTSLGGTIELMGPDWDPEQHEVQRWCQLLGWLGLEADPAELELNEPVSQPKVRGAVIIHPGAAAPARRWPIERFVDIARTLATQGHQVVITGNANESEMCTELATSAELPAEAMLAGALDLDELAALVAAARLVVCGDTGMGHLASAYRRPSVLLFGPTSPARWGPPPEQRHSVLWAGQEGDPHADRPDPGLLGIEVADVLAAIACHPGFAASPPG